MFAYIKGKYQYTVENYIVLEANNIGYKIYTSKTTIDNIEKIDEAIVYTEYIQREDGVYLYGFYTVEELELFNRLRSVSSIGPKNTLAILSTLDINEIKLAIIENDVDTLCSVPGIGKKTASRIVLELKDSISLPVETKSNKQKKVLNTEKLFAIDALTNLGYNKNEVTDIINGLDIENMSIEEIIKITMQKQAMKDDR